ncbi:MAG: uncharacterized protein JWM10_5406, partial [Myxococcaceae bacterium]|nr:uncharacterized protein [Myxococcaceae bacterium]
GAATNGCEVELLRSPAHCGACGNACPPRAHAAAACADGACGLACETGWGNCDGDAANGCETDLATTAPHCGVCGRACAPRPNGSSECAAGVCAGACAAGFGDCDGDAANGCEVTTTDNPAHCGGCGMACAARPHTAASCAEGACRYACAAGFVDCDGDAANGCEVEVATSVDHCGACGRACSRTNGTATCAAGVCAIVCATGFGNCDGDAANGCETDTASNALNCGACRTACSFPGASARCDRGVCVRTTCGAGLGDCDGTSANGCETTLATDAANCGACGNRCVLANATAVCRAGGCAVGTCAAGFADCDGVAANGCEVALGTDPLHCGSCPLACNATNGAASCVAGACRITCAAGFGNCDANVANGCEVNLNTTVASCGACGRACALAHATSGCAAGACTIGACDAGFANCDGNVANGCETDLNATVGACGTCGTTCNVPNAAASCVAGRCAVAACNAGSADCDANAANGCETPTTSNANCGACGVVCGAGTRCAGGTCQSSCPAGTTFCATTGVCADFQGDASNCGMCGTICPALSNASAACRAGACAFTCNTGFADCDANVANGCEANLGTSVTSCGACGRACAPPHATGACTTGLCGVVACDAGFGDCNGDPSDGCEVDLTATATSCGTCSNACRPPNGTGVCTAGRCGVAACDPGKGNCDGNAANGCETTLGTNTNCGACGAACATGSFCSEGTCVSACSAPTSYCANTLTCNDLSDDTLNCGACGRTCPVPPNATATCGASTCGFSCNGSTANCDASAGNGCEVDLSASVANCGACGAACTLANATPTCGGGACAVATCNLNYGNCDGVAGNGCEVNTSTSPANCGACGNACSLPNATPACSGGACAVGTCNAGFGNCNGRTSDGCETPLNSGTNCGACGTRCAAGTFCSNNACVSSCPSGTTYCASSGGCINLQTNPDSCGSCGNTCPSAPRVVRSCAAGVCGGSCESGYGNCDGNAGNGCETNLTTGVTNCGACNNVCRFANATPVCAVGTCAIGACYPNFANCNGATTDGCEVNLQNDTRNCGACGRACGNGQVCRIGSCR